MDNLRPLKSGISLAAASERVRQEIRGLDETDRVAPKLVTGKEFRRQAKELEDALARLEALLNSEPTTLACYLFRPWPSQSFAELYYALNSPLPFGSIDEIERACLDERDELVARFDATSKKMCSRRQSADRRPSELRSCKTCVSLYSLLPPYRMV